ncbi:uncharacterized protein BX663DRAFT_506309 [Cokeromyces recurvatus]|uniref:uncharacterized protein n=1 Tax=Cokeromyces recurvatus TaxID=90255 RepID=UPI00221FD821|nr:uncharacterized protein BX663DRAFT_506309 [Cokeromyces recurvatus]KAI7904072.1 hypothetical protein BX663DRAFT_506309 [Cokeromyces recurvatus]
MIISKLLTSIIILQLIKPSLQFTFIQDDVLSLPHYKVYVTKEKVANTDINSDEKNRVIMTSALGQPFSCIIPNVEVEQEKLDREKLENAKVETEENKKKMIEKGLKLLEPLEQNCIQFYAHTSQYWVYEYCHNQYVRQFHLERSHDGNEMKEQETASFYLGFHPSMTLDDNTGDHANNKKELLLSKKKKLTPSQVYLKAPTELRTNNKGQERYLLQIWKEGSICDLTGKPRTVEIQYRCDLLQGQDYVSSFVEKSTCNYQLIISTPRLCEEMDLSRRHHAESHRIKCRPIVSEKWIEQEQEAAAAAEAEAKKAKEEETNSIVMNENTLLLNQKDQVGNPEHFLLEMISELTDQINQLKLQMNNKKGDKRTPLLTIDERGQIIFSGMNELVLGLDKNDYQQQQQRNHFMTKDKKNKEQDENKQAYHQKYFIAEQ